ncbi:hypothetical protein ACHAXT_001905 [Thalassiosira profunda]
MLIVSWNVAGLKPALQKIQNDYGSSSTAKQKSASSSASSSNAPACHPLATYLRLHGNVDIFCVQEHKDSAVPIVVPVGTPPLLHPCPGYESFWSCATDQKSRGFNGVVTYARTGMVKVGGLSSAGGQGTGRPGTVRDDGPRQSFVLFNVYVPCGGGGETLPRKMKFLNALKGAMDRQREKGKHVMLVGDMNLKVDKRDVPWKSLSVNVDELLSSMNGGRARMDRSFPKWKTDIANALE